jgi:hypothetical protein
LLGLTLVVFVLVLLSGILLLLSSTVETHVGGVCAAAVAVWHPGVCCHAVRKHFVRHHEAWLTQAGCNVDVWRKSCAPIGRSLAAQAAAAAAAAAAGQDGKDPAVASHSAAGAAAAATAGGGGDVAAVTAAAAGDAGSSGEFEAAAAAAAAAAAGDSGEFESGAAGGKVSSNKASSTRLADGELCCRLLQL